MSLSHKADSSDILPFWIPTFAGMTGAWEWRKVGMTDARE